MKSCKVSFLRANRGPALACSKSPLHHATNPDRSFFLSALTRPVTLRKPGQRFRIPRNRLRDRPAVYKLPFFAALDQFRIRQDLQVMRNRRRRHALHRHQFAASQIRLCRNHFVNSQPGLVRQCFRYSLNLSCVHRQS